LLSFQPPAVGEEEIEAVAETLRSGWLTTGPRTEELERRFAEYVGARHAVALASGTAAMHLSLLAAGVGPGDEVVTTPITWPATANVIVHCGATPVFADVRESDLNIDPDAVAAAVTQLGFDDHARSRNVAGHQIDGELNAVEGQIEHLRQCAHHQSFAGAWDSFDEDVPASEEGGQDLLDDCLVANDDTTQLPSNAFEGHLEVLD
jgi:threonine aldolase